MRPVLKRALPTDGVNLVDEPSSLQETEAQWTKNVWPSKPGVISPRPSMDPLLFRSSSAAPWVDDVRNFVKLSGEIRGASFVMLTRDTAGVYGGITLATLRNTQGNRLEVVDSQTIDNVFGRGCFCPVGQSAVLFLDGFSPGWIISNGDVELPIWTPPYDDTPAPPAAGIAEWGLMNSWYAVSDRLITRSMMETGEFNQVPPDGPGGIPRGWRPRIAVMTRERVVYFNLSDRHRDAMLWADAGNPALVNVISVDYGGLADYDYDMYTGNVLDVDGPYVRLGSDNSDITAALVMSISNEQSLMNEAILVFKRDHAFMVQGEPAQTIDVGASPLGTMQVTELSVRAGCVGAQACCVTPYGAFWVGPDDVWMMARGNLPLRVGTKISPRLRAQSVTDAWKIQCTYADGRLIVSLASGGGDVGDSSLDEQWWLDLRRGAPTTWQQARWFGPQCHVPADATHLGVQCLVDDRSFDKTLGVVVSQPEGTGGDGIVSLTSLDAGTGEDNGMILPQPAPWLPSSEFMPGSEIFPSYAPTGYENPFCVRSHPSAPGAQGLKYRAILPHNGATGSTPPSTFGLLSLITDAGTYWEQDDIFIATPEYRTNNAVLMDILSREETLGDRSTQKLFQGVEVSHSLNAAMAIQLVALGDELGVPSERSSEGTTGDQLAAGGPGKLNEQILAARATGTRFLPASAVGGRQLGRGHAFRLKTEGHFVFERNKYFVFWVDVGTHKVVAYIPKGIYGTMEDVVDALNAQIVVALTALGFNTAEFNVVVAIRDTTNNVIMPFVAIGVVGTASAPVGFLHAVIPLLNKGSSSHVVGGVTLPAGPQPYTDSEVGEIDLYDDTTYIMGLMGFTDFLGTGYGAFIDSGMPVAIAEKQVVANMPFHLQRTYPLFDLFALNFNIRSFAKRPT